MPTCTFCNKEDQAIKNRVWKVIKDYEYEMLELSCGHVNPIRGLRVNGDYQVKSKHGYEAYPFQLKSAEFARKARFRCIFAHEMGLGKMIINAIILKHHIEELQPILFICKSSLTVQTAHQTAEWVGVPSQIIDTSKDNPLWDVVPVIIVSFDLLRRVKWLDDAKGKVKTIIIDEFQNVKNTDAQRTQKVMELAETVKYIMGNSGTPVKNAAIEYYPMLHMVDPKRFKSMAEYERQHLWGRGLKNPAAFKDFTKDIVIRYERLEVMPELPSIRRDYQYHHLGEEVKKRYVEMLNKFRQFYAENGMKNIQTYGQGLAFLSMMRHLTGISKVDPCVDYVKEFLESTERKITIFLHHKDVGSMVRLALESYCKEKGMAPPLILHSGLNNDQRFQIQQDFYKPENRILIASTLVGAEGMNLQCCSDMVMLERQWNPANEEQAEARFPRPGTTASVINATYLVAVGTIDEFFAELVEKKRAVCYEVNKGKSAVRWDETEIMKELADILMSKGLPRWAH